MRNRILIRNPQKFLPLKRQELRLLADFTLSAENVSGAEVSISIVDDRQIQELNRHYRQKDSATDVLAFRMADAPQYNLRPEILGDVVLSAETAQRRGGGHTERELQLYLVHGLLHLLGYDDNDPVNARMMRRRQKEIMRGYEQS